MLLVPMFYFTFEMVDFMGVEIPDVAALVPYLGDDRFFIAEYDKPNSCKAGLYIINDFLHIDRISGKAFLHHVQLTNQNCFFI
jgi:hypothetical protein